MKKTIACLLAVLLACTAFSACLTVSASGPSSVEKKVGGVNVALGASYVTSELFRQNDEWQWSADAPIAYPDTDSEELTDGKFPMDGASHYDGAFFGFRVDSPDYAENGYAWMRVDLGQAYDLSALVLYVGTAHLSNGIFAPETVSFYAVEDMDGSNPVEIGSVSPEDDDTVPYIPCALETEVTAQYIEIRISAFNWMFVTEFEAYASNLMLGDLDGSNVIDASDYLVLKRYCLDSLTLTDTQKVVADVNRDREIDSLDYMMVKRHVLGTLEIG